MRRLVLAVLVVLLVPCGGSPSHAQKTPQSDPTVYITRTGEKYHRATCRSLSRSQIAKKLSEVAAAYGACRICEPPVATGVSAEHATSSPVRRGLLSTADTPSPDDVVYKGNQKSHVLHEPGCAYYDCENCTQEFESVDAALAAGLRLHSCIATVERPAKLEDPQTLVATPVRCEATTKKGTQCKRTASAGSRYCWQHQ